MKKFATLFCLVLLITNCRSDNHSYQTTFFEISSMTDESYQDLRPFEKILSDKRIVQIGESGHGMAEYFILKTRLVKYLHEKLGYNVLAVEGALSDCSGAFMDIENLNDSTLMRACFYGAWNFKEALPLFTYIKSTQSTPNPLYLTGFDNLPTGGYFPVFFKSLINQVDSSKLSAFEHVYAHLSHFAYRQVSDDFFTGRQQSVLDSIWVCEQFVMENKPAIENQYPNNPHIVAHLVQSLGNIKSTFSVDKANYNQTTMDSIRDRLMGENVIWLAESVYEDEKMIVWAHNAHISKAYSQNRYFKRQGEYVDEALGDQVYTIGLYGYEGSAWAFFLRDNFNFKTPKDFSLESEMKRLNHDMSFLDIGDPTTSAPAFTWLYDSISSFEWGQWEHTIIPARHYDGLMFINEITAPTLIDRK